MMTRERKVYVFSAVMAACATAKLLTGCHDPIPAAYGAERILCVERAATAAEARCCIAEVDARYAQDVGIRCESDGGQ